MIATCKHCSRMFGDVAEEDASDPNGYECAACDAIVNKTPGDDQPTTVELKNDDPDDHIDESCIRFPD